jgi:lantibiotic biosynthesis protein
MSNPATFVPANFFALRTPLLPFATFLQWSAELHAPDAFNQMAAMTTALSADRVALRQQLRALLAHPVVREAIFVASPDLDAALARWQENPDSEKGLRAVLCCAILRVWPVAPPLLGFFPAARWV